MNFVIDYHFFHHPNFIHDQNRGADRIIVKEFAIYSVNGNFRASFIVKPPSKMEMPGFDDAMIPSDSIHDIEWDDGYTSFKDCVKILRQICSKAVRVYVKGDVRIQYLKRNVFSAKREFELVNLNSLCCPSYNDKYYALMPQCYYKKHFGLPSPGDPFGHTCALQKAYFYTRWLQDLFSEFDDAIKPTEKKKKRQRLGDTKKNTKLSTNTTTTTTKA